MNDTVLIYVEDTTPGSAALRHAIGSAHQSSGGHLYVIPAETLTDPKDARIIRSPEDLKEIRSALSASDSLFANAWFSRSGEKNRAGDGKSWDAKDFDCP